ncbi:hypothetical protein Trydic_g2628 [Trypoxylus dichotomus]
MARHVRTELDAAAPAKKGGGIWKPRVYGVSSGIRTNFGKSDRTSLLRRSEGKEYKRDNVVLVTCSKKSRKYKALLLQVD